LVPLGDALSVPEVRFVFPQAPLDLGREFAGGRAWWMIDMERLQFALQTGALRDLSNDVPEGMAEANEKVGAMLDALQTELEVPGHRLILGGFSQGAMLATDVVLRSDREISGVVLMSGTLLAQHEWGPAMAKRAGLPALQSHGQYDPLLPFSLAEQLGEKLDEAGWDRTWIPFPGQHEIPMAVLAQLHLFIRERFGLEPPE
jgi:phospholipase/carboxylesterase